LLCVSSDVICDGRVRRPDLEHDCGPTYIPDLVNACLDLLIDRECGVWHLTTGGAITRAACFPRQRQADVADDAAAMDVGVTPKAAVVRERHEFAGDVREREG